MADVFIAAATRTPFGRYGGRLAGLRCDDLAAAPLTSLMARYPGMDWGAVDEVVLGREQKLEDSTLGWRCINPMMRARYGVDSMTQTADNLARERGIARACQDAYAWRSQQRTAHAQAEGWLAEEITAVQVRHGTESISVSEDEHPRPDITPAQLAKLKPLLGPESTITAGNASGINDGACA